MAEGEGFEPPEPCGSAVFKTAAIDHSATLPINYLRTQKLLTLQCLVESLRANGKRTRKFSMNDRLWRGEKNNGRRVRNAKGRFTCQKGSMLTSFSPCRKARALRGNSLPGL